MKRKLFALASLAASVIVTGTASAASVSATLFNAVDSPNGVQPGTMDLNLQFGAISIANAYVGQINWHSATSTDWTAGLNPQLNAILGPNQTFSTYCIEGTQNVFFGTNETWSLGVVNLSSAPTPAPAMGTTKASEITELYDRSFSGIGTNNELAAAFQLAVWEIVDDGIPTLGGETAADFNSGTFQASGDTTAINDAVGMLNAIGSAAPLIDSFTVYALSDAGIQDQIFAIPTGGTPVPPAVPLPAALPMGLAMMGAMGLIRGIRRRAL